MMLDEWQCSVCGHIHKGGAPPSSCPTCGAPFTAFERREADPRARFRGIEIVSERPAGHRYVIVGNSSAGRSAARAIQAIDEDGEITVISEEPATFYMRPLLPDLIGGMDRTRLFGIASDYDETGLTVMAGETVTGVDPAEKQVTCASGKTVPFDALLLATGSSLVQIPWPGSQAGGIAYLRTLAEAERIMEAARGAKHVVVVGGGFLGLEFVRAFLARGVQITHLIRDGHVGAPGLDQRAGGLVRKALEDAGVTVALEEEVESFESRNGRVSGVTTSKGRTVECDLVGVAVGVRPRVELAQEAGLEVDRGIVVNRRLETSVEGVYAAGDVAQALDVAWGEQRVNTSWRNAKEQGELVGIAMAGGAGEYAGALGSNYQLAAGLPFCVLGIANPADEENYEIQWDMDESARTYQKTVKRDDVLVGAMVVGDLSRTAEFEAAIRGDESAAAGVPAEQEAKPGPIEIATERSSCMRKMTEENMSTSFAGESQAHMKYLNFAKKAEEEGKQNVARLFRATSFAEQVHASEQLDALGGIGSTADNLAAGIAGESFEIEEMYPAYTAVAQDQDEALAQRCFRHAIEAEKMHVELYQRSKKAVDAGGDPAIDDIWVCSCCGYTLEGDAPESCPICTAPKSEFVKF